MLRLLEAGLGEAGVAVNILAQNKDWGPPERVTDCEAYPCNNKKCAECESEINSEDHMVLWWGPAGWAVCRACARKAVMRS